MAEKSAPDSGIKPETERRHDRKTRRRILSLAETLFRRNDVQEIDALIRELRQLRDEFPEGWSRARPDMRYWG